MKEIWKDIPGYEGFYQVSDMGRVRSLDREVKNLNMKSGKQILKGIILSLRTDNSGYKEAGLSKLGNKKIYRVNRLVWFSFMGGNLNYYNPKDKTIVCHKNHKREDNRLENLCLGTQLENMQMSVNDGRINGWKEGREFYKDRLLMRLIYKTGKYHKSEISERFGYHRTYLGKLQKGLL